MCALIARVRVDELCAATHAVVCQTDAYTTIVPSIIFHNVIYTHMHKQASREPLDMTECVRVRLLDDGTEIESDGHGRRRGVTY